MTADTPALGAQQRVEGLAVINVYVAPSRAMLRLGQITRLQHAEAVRALGACSSTTPREVADAWISVNAMLTQAVDDLLEVEATMPAADNQLFVEAVLYRYRTGVPWRLTGASFEVFGSNSARLSRHRAEFSPVRHFRACA